MQTEFIQIKNISITDSRIISKIHLESFDGFFLSTLGADFMCTFYKSMIKSKKCIGICATVDNKIVGFAIGTSYSKGFYKKLICKNLIYFGLHAMVLLKNNPKAILRIMKNLNKIENEKDYGDYAELYSICVLPAFSKFGIGQKLLIHFEKEASLKYCSKIALTTDVDNNENVISFYKKNGYKIFYEFITYPNRKMYKYIKEL